MDSMSKSVWSEWWRHRPETCSVEQLLEILTQPNGTTDLPTDSFNQVFDGIYIGDQSIAKNVSQLMKLNITHVLNAAFGSDQTLNLIEVSPKIYFDNNIDFLAIEAIDCSSFGLWRHFDKSTQFIGFCIESGGKVLVHCKQGISRSAALVVAYLMISKHLAVTEAVRTVRSNRAINPNEGFLAQLCLLNDILVNTEVNK